MTIDNQQPEFNKNDAFWLGILLMLALFVCGLLNSCKSYVPISKNEIVHDTMTYIRFDTVRQQEKVIFHDSIHERHDTTIIVREDGSVVGKNTNHYYYRNIYQSDSSSFYKAKYDSLTKTKQSQTTTVVEKKDNGLTWKDKLLIVAAFIIAIAVVYVYNKDFKKVHS